MCTFQTVLNCGRNKCRTQSTCSSQTFNVFQKQTIQLFLYEAAHNQKNLSLSALNWRSQKLLTIQTENSFLESDWQPQKKDEKIPITQTRLGCIMVGDMIFSQKRERNVSEYDFFLSPVWNEHDSPFQKQVTWYHAPFSGLSVPQRRLETIRIRGILLFNTKTKMKLMLIMHPWVSFCSAELNMSPLSLPEQPVVSAHILFEAGNVWGGPAWGMRGFP